MKKRIKLIIIIVSSLVILTALILLSIYLYRNVGSWDDGHVYTVDDIKLLIANSKELSSKNVYCRVKNPSYTGFSELYIKDGKSKGIAADTNGCIITKDNKMYIVDDNEKLIFVTDSSKNEKETYYGNDRLLFLDNITDIQNGRYKGKNVLIVKQTLDENYYVTLYIDPKTGLILRSIEFEKDETLEMEIYIDAEYELVFDQVKDSDFDLPTDYKVYD